MPPGYTYPVSTPPIITVEQLEKTYRQNFWSPRVEALKGISLSVQQGVIFGFLGPNGAGKTTTIKVLTGLIAPSAGRAELFGLPTSDPKARRRMGFLPENPYIYPYLTAREFVRLSAELSGLTRRSAASQAERLLAHVGIAYAADRPARKLSKGMLQRAGLAAALAADPELLILDEPMSGLDPVGRKEVRDIILGERSAGRTIFFSTHILTDVETLCDDVTILRKGQVVVSGKLTNLLSMEAKIWEVVLEGNASLWTKLSANNASARRLGARFRVEIEGAQALQGLLSDALAQGATVHEVLPRHESLEDLFMREAL